MRFRVYNKDDTMFQDIATLQVYRIDHAPPQHSVTASEEVAELTARVVEALNAAEIKK
jgi:hypothetical protein